MTKKKAHFDVSSPNIKPTSGDDPPFIELEDELYWSKVLKNQGLERDVSFVDIDQSMMARHFGEGNSRVLLAINDQEKAHIVELPEWNETNETNEVQKVFTLNSAFKQIGGFGRFQVFMTLVFALVRSYGMLMVYIYAQNTEPQPYLCRTNSISEFAQCQASLICEMRSLNLTGLEYKPDT